MRVGMPGGCRRCLRRLRGDVSRWLGARRQWLRSPASTARAGKPGMIELLAMGRRRERYSSMNSDFADAWTNNRRQRSATMKRVVGPSLAAILVAGIAVAQSPSIPKPPETPKRPVTDEYHGVTVR